MGLAGVGLPNKGEVFVGIDGSQCRETAQPLHISASDLVKIKVVKGLWNLLRETAGTEQKLYSGTVFLGYKAAKNLCHINHFHISQVVLQYNGMIASAGEFPNLSAAFQSGLHDQ